MKSNEIDRFYAYVRMPDAPADCWFWTGTVGAKDRAQFYYEGDTRYASHFVLTYIKNEPRPLGQNALHSCDNGLCVNPEHLSWGTQSLNLRQARDRGRSNAKLDWDEVQNMRDIRSSTGAPYRVIGELFGVSTGHVHKIVNSKCWQPDTRVA